MLICCDFDGTIVSQERPYNDVTTPFRFMPMAREGLLSLRRAGHTLVLWSGRARLALRRNDPSLDPLVCAGLRPHRPDRDFSLNEARFQQMLRFVETELAGIFAYVYKGGELDKPGADLFIDNIAVRLAEGVGGQSWRGIAMTYGGLQGDGQRNSRPQSRAGDNRPAKRLQR